MIDLGLHHGFMEIAVGEGVASEGGEALGGEKLQEAGPGGARFPVHLFYKGGGEPKTHGHLRPAQMFAYIRPKTANQAAPGGPIPKGMHIGAISKAEVFQAKTGIQSPRPGVD
jgi:hypothetical protein